VSWSNESVRCRVRRGVRYAMLWAAVGLCGCTTATVVPLQYATLGGKRLEVPLVEGAVGGRATKMIVDTGAATSAVDARLVAAARLAVVTTAGKASAAGGEEFPLRRVDRPELTIAGFARAIVALPALVIQLPDVLAQLGIGAVLSPQRIYPDRAVVIDLLANWLIETSARAAAARLRRASGTEWEARLCRSDGDSGISGRAFVVSVVIDAVPTQLIVDTGANQTTVYDTTEVGRRIAAGAVASGHFGDAAGVREARQNRATIAFAGRSFPLVVGLAPGRRSAECGTDGQLGMDVLGACVLVIDGERLRARCSG
jgi:predicted aspartyl protease